MPRWTKLISPLTVSFLARPTFFSSLNGANCVIECQVRFSCNTSSTQSCYTQQLHHNQLCDISCKGQGGGGGAQWGGIAYNAKEKVYGFTYGKGDKAIADKQAMDFCVKQGGSKCIVAASFSDTCGAVAASGDLVTWGKDGNRYNAEQRALGECKRLGGKSCEVRSSLCSR